MKIMIGIGTTKLVISFFRLTLIHIFSSARDKKPASQKAILRIYLLSDHFVYIPTISCSIFIFHYWCTNKHHPEWIAFFIALRSFRFYNMQSHYWSVFLFLLPSISILNPTIHPNPSLLFQVSSQVGMCSTVHTAKKLQHFCCNAIAYQITIIITSLSETQR